MARDQELDIATGRYFTESEYDHAAPVAVIGWDVQDQLFGHSDPIGRTIRIAGYPVKVIGTLAQAGHGPRPEPGQAGLHAADLQEALRRRREHRHLHQADRRRRGMADAQDEVRTILRAPPRKRSSTRTIRSAFVTAEMLQTLWRSISAGAFR